VSSATVLPTITASNFPTAMTALNLARERVNDLIATPFGAPAPPADPALNFTQVGGTNLLDVSTQSASQRTQVIFQAGWKDFIRYLEDQGHRAFIGGNLIVPALPANTSPDPAAQSYISWTEFFDGQNYWSTPVLPTSFAAPLKIGERITGTNAPFSPMHCGIDGIYPGWVRGIYNQKWEWRENRLYLIGAIGQTDLQIRYIKGLPPISAVGNTPWYWLPLPIPDCEVAVACFIAARVGSARGPEFVADMKAEAKEQADYIFNRQARADQRVNVRRIPHGRGGRRNFWYGL
jgi:hypothetical protein